MVIIIADKAGFRTKNITGERVDHSKMIKRSTHQDDIMNLTVYASNNRTVKYASETDRTGRRNKSTVTLGDISPTLSTIINRTRQKIIVDIEEINIISNLQDHIYIYRIPHSTTVEYTLFSSVSGAYNKVD